MFKINFRIEVTLWSKERIKDQINKTTPNDVVIQNLSFFPGKIIISCYGHISKLGKIKSIEKQLSLKSGWTVKYTIIPISGNFDTEFLDSLFNAIPRLEINSVSINQQTKNVAITFQKNPTNFLRTLQEIESKLKFTIKVNSLESENFITLLELGDMSKKDSYLDDINKEKIDIQDLKTKIKSLLPTWIKTSKITAKKDRVEIFTTNDISDIERISFLTLLLESQIGLKIEIKQSYSKESQISTLENLLKNYFKEFSIETDNTKKELEVTVSYSDFPLNDEILTKIKNEMYKKTKLVINEFKSNFEENSEQICLQLKEWIVKKHPNIEYCFVHYNKKSREFDVLLPEDNSNVEGLTLELFKEEILESYRFTYPFQVKWIEEDPVFYLKERIFIGEQKRFLQKIDYNRPKITIYYNDSDNLPFHIWEKIIFRLIRFEINIIDPDTGNSKDIFDFKKYKEELDNTKISELLLKVIPSELEINSIVFDDIQDKFVIKYDNLIKKNQVVRFLEKWATKLNISIDLQPSRNQDEIIFQIVSNLPEWLINPKLHFDHDENLLLIVQNDYEDEERLKKFVSEQSKLHLVPIVLKINLNISRIKQIIYQSLQGFIEISRLKIYPEKENIYLEGILKTDQDEELLEEELNRIEAKTKYVIESYIKRRSSSSSKQSVHDLLQSLLNTYDVVPFTQEQYKEAELIEDFDALKHGNDRIDLRDTLDCFSIDPTGTKAVDECISVQRITQQDKEDELLIGIHVSDILLFLPKDSLLDKEAKRRSFSVYLNHEKATYNLFPENLIEKMSLLEGIDRPTLSLFIRITLDSTIEEFFIKKTIIKNKKQFTYNEVNENLIEQKGEFLTDLQLLVSITSQFKSNRIIRGSINLDFMPDNIADQIVSELMIMANRLVGYHLQSLPGQKVFRNQHIQSYTYLLLQKNFQSMGYQLDILNKNPLTDINRILQEAAINGESELIMSELRNYLSNAYYSHTCTGHEALGTKWYSQWTSPLRKYMDVVVHRLLNNEYVEDLHYLCQYSSAIERLLKIKIDSSISSYYLDKIQLYINNGHELKVGILKQTSRHVILSTDLDFFLFILLNGSTINDKETDMINQFLDDLKENSPLNIQLHKVSRDKKDINLVFSPTNESRQSFISRFIKAKIIFLD